MIANKVKDKPEKMSYREMLRHPKWQQKKLEIMSRDHFKCMFCDSEDNLLNVHHLCYLPNRKPWEYDSELLITICDECHDHVHEELTKTIAILSRAAIIKKVDLILLDEIINLL